METEVFVGTGVLVAAGIGVDLGCPEGRRHRGKIASPHDLFAPPIKLFMHASPSFYARDVQPPWRSRLSLAPMRIVGLDLGELPGQRGIDLCHRPPSR
jgi:hypothetical protein